MASVEELQSRSLSQGQRIKALETILVETSKVLADKDLEILEKLDDLSALVHDNIGRLDKLEKKLQPKSR